MGMRRILNHRHHRAHRQIRGRNTTVVRPVSAARTSQSHPPLKPHLNPQPQSPSQPRPHHQPQPHSQPHPPHLPKKVLPKALIPGILFSRAMRAHITDHTRTLWQATQKTAHAAWHPLGWSLPDIRLRIKRLQSRLTGQTLYRISSVFMAFVLLMTIVFPVLNFDSAEAATATILPDTTITTTPTWTQCNAGTCTNDRHTYINEDATGSYNGSTFIGTGATGSSEAAAAVEFGFTTVGNVDSVSSITVNIAARSQTNANGGTLDDIDIQLRIAGSLLTAVRRTPAFSTSNWFLYSATFNGTWTQANLDGAQVRITRVVQGSGNPTNQRDDVRIAALSADVTYTSAVTLEQSSYRWFENDDSAYGWGFETSSNIPLTHHVSLEFNSQIYIIGGQSNTFNNRLYRSNDGTNWEIVTDNAPYGQKNYATGLVYDGKMWILGGKPDNNVASATSEVWSSSDGVNWTQETASAAWPERSEHASFVFDNKMWITGGRHYDGANINYNDVWSSSDGVNWTQETAGAAWSARWGLKSAVYDSKMWISGGRTSSNQNDVWSSSNGINWTQETASAGWNARYHHGMIVMGSSLWVYGGSSDSGYVNDVWSSTNGINWTQETASAGWSARSGFPSVTFNGEIIVIGGFTGTLYSQAVWSSSDGINWTDISYPYRRIQAASEVYDNKVWVLGGNVTGSSTAYSSQILSYTENVSSETNFTVETNSPGWSARGLLSSAVFNSKLWIMGGWDGTNRYNDVWSSSNGVNWTQETASAAWSARDGHTSLFFDNKVWVIGGQTSSQFTNEVWSSSDGINWTLEANAPWTGRTQHTSVVYDNKIWVIGGSSDASTRLNDVWSSADGVNWTQESAAAPWNIRTAHTSVVQDGKMWVIGGRDGNTTYFNDMWSSTDGSSWQQEISGDWSARAFHTSVAYNDKIWVSQGFNGPTYFTDTYSFVSPVSPTPYAAQDTPTTAPAEGTPFRLRASVSAGLGELAADTSFKLQYAERQGLTCTLDFSAGEVYQDVPNPNQGTQLNSINKLANPSTLPTGDGRSTAFSPDGKYMSVGHGTFGPPYLTIYEVDSATNTFTKIADPGTLPTGIGYGTAFSPDGKYMSVAHATSPFITIYEIDSATNTFTKITNPGTLPTGDGFGTAFSPDGKYMSVAHATSPFITIYEIDSATNTFTKITNPGTLPTGDGRDTAFSPDGKYMSIGHLNSPNITIYEINSSTNTFTKITNPATLPANNGLGTAFSPDGKYMSVAHGTSPFITIYEINSSTNTFTKITNPANLPTDVGNSTAFSPDGKYMSVGQAFSPYIVIYEIDAATNTFTKTANPDVLPNGTGFGTAFSPNGKYMSVAHGSSPYITIYEFDFEILPIKFHDNTNILDGSGIASSVDDPNPGLGNKVLQSYVESNNFTNPNAIPLGDYGVWDFSLVDNNAPGETPYCFRIVDSTGSELSTYSVIPELTTVPPTYTQADYRWFEEGIADYKNPENWYGVYPSTPGTAWATAYNDDESVLAVGHSGGRFLTLIDTVDSNPAKWKTVETSISLPGIAYGVTFDDTGDTLVIAHNAAPGITLIDSSDPDPSNWSEINTSLSLPGTGTAALFKGDILVVSHAGGIRLIDSSDPDPSNWSEITSAISIPGVAWDVTFSPAGDVLVVAHENGNYVTFINASDPDPSNWAVVTNTNVILDGNGYNALFHGTGDTLVTGHTGGNGITFVDSSDPNPANWVEITNNNIVLPGAVRGSDFGASGSLLALAHRGFISGPYSSIVDTSDINPANWDIVSNIDFNIDTWDVVFNSGSNTVVFAHQDHVENHITIIDSSDPNPVNWSKIRNDLTLPKSINDLAFSSNDDIIVLAHSVVDSNSVTFIDSSLSDYSDWSLINNSNITLPGNANSAVFNHDDTTLVLGHANGNGVTFVDSSDPNPSNWNTIANTNISFTSSVSAAKFTNDGNVLILSRFYNGDGGTIAFVDSSDPNPSNWDIITNSNISFQESAYDLNFSNTEDVLVISHAGTGSRVAFIDSSDPNPANWTTITNSNISLPGNGRDSAFNEDNSVLVFAHFSGDGVTIVDSSDPNPANWVEIPNSNITIPSSSYAVGFAQQDDVLIIGHALGSRVTIIDSSSSDASAWSVIESSLITSTTVQVVALNNGADSLVLGKSSSGVTVVDINSINTVGPPQAALNQPFELADPGGTPRLRLLLNVDDKDAASSVLKLQYAPRVGSVCSTNFTGYSYVDVPPSLGSGNITYFNNPNAEQGMAFDSSVDDPSNARTSVLQSYVEQNTFSVSNLTPSGQTAMWDFAIEDTSSLGGSYCFRVVKSDGTPLNTYSFIPELGSPPRTPQFMRHGRWFDTAGQSRPFYWGR
jgi:6-phosphogluconolactonase (cycloisomerase 2 family)